MRDLAGDECLPSYARPNISSRLPDYSNAAAEQIRAAFVPSSFRTISQLGKSQLVLASGEVVPFKAGAAPVATFGDFTFSGGAYELSWEDKQRLRNEHEEKVRQIDDLKPFFAGYCSRRLKFEDPVYERMLEQPRDADFTSSGAGRKAANAGSALEAEGSVRPLLRPFVPPGKHKPLEHPGRAQLFDILVSLRRTVASDWPAGVVTIVLTTDDVFVLYFKEDEAVSAEAVLTYMNIALRRDPAVLEFNLKKVSDGWNFRTPDGYLLFALRPPWVSSFISSGTTA